MSTKNGRKSEARHAGGPTGRPDGPPDVSWQAQANQGHDIGRFTIDWEAKRVKCPEGRASVLWRPGQDRWGNDVISTPGSRVPNAWPVEAARCVPEPSLRDAR
jgi:transposase